MDAVTLALAKSYVAKTADSLGSLKGAPCTISKIEETDDGSIVTYQWTGTSGAIETRTMTVKNGIGIQSIVRDNANNKVIYTMTDGTRHTVDDIEVEAVDVSYTNAEEPTVNNVKEALDLLFEEGGGVLEEEINPNVSMGSVKANYPVGTPLEVIIRDMLQEKIAPTVSVSINPNKTLYDIVSESVPSLTINATIVKKTNPIEKVEFYVNGALKHTVTSGVANGGTFPYVYNTEIKETTTIKVVVTDSEGLSATSTKKIEFYPVIYYGVLDANTSTVTEQMIKTLNTKLQNTKVFTYENITTDWGKVCVCVPKMLGNITSIFDPINNLSYNSTFETSTVSCNGYDYTVLKQIDASAASGITLKFS